MDIDSQLDEILFKYDIDKYFPGYRQMCRAKGLIRKLADEWERGKEEIVCIFGAYDTALYDIGKLCFEKILTGRTKNVKFVICKKRNQKCDQKNGMFEDVFDLSPLENLREESSCRIYLCSHIGELFIGHWLRKKQYQYISIYDYFSLHNLHITHEWYEDMVSLNENYFWPDMYFDFRMCTLFDLQRKLEIYNNKKWRILILKKLYSLALILRDFLLAKSYLHALRLYHDDEIDDCLNSMNEIEKLLESIYQRILAKKSRSIVVTWVDDISYIEAKKVKSICSAMESGICFDNMFNVTPWTQPVFRTMMTGKKELDDKNYDLKEINAKSSPVIHELESKGFKIKFQAGISCWEGLENNKYIDKFVKDFSPASMRLWETLRQILLTNDDVFIQTHIFQEAHEPLIHAKMTDDMIGQISLVRNSRRNSGVSVVDEQLEFYLKYLNAAETHVLMSDHGDGFNWGERIHPFMVIMGSGYEKRHIKSLYSHLDFPQLIHKILKREEIGEFIPKREYVEIQNLDWYNKQGVSEILSKKESLLGHPGINFGFRGVVTTEYVYFHFNNGFEYLAKRNEAVFPPPDERWYPSTYAICDSSKLDVFRKMARIEENIQVEEEKLKFFKYFVKVYRNALPRNLTKIYFLNQLFDSFPEQSLAVRMGGNHTMHLYDMLSESNRKKISCIIDRDKNCLCKKLPYPIVSWDELDTNHISCILLSSKTHQKFLTEELCRYPDLLHTSELKHIMICDLYKWFFANGLCLKEKFYKFETVQEDYNVNFPF